MRWFLDRVTKILRRHEGLAAFGSTSVAAIGTFIADKAFDAKNWLLFGVAVFAALFVGAGVPWLLSRATALGHTHTDAVEHLRKLLEALARAFRSDTFHVRANIMLANDDHTKRKVDSTTAYNMKGDADHDLEIGMHAGASGQAVLSRAAAFRDLRIQAQLGGPTDGIPEEDLKKVRPKLRSILSAPIRDPDDPDRMLGTVQVDSDAVVEEIGFDKQAAWATIQIFGDLAGFLVKGLRP